MGAEPFRYLVDYQKNIQRALDQLRLEIFRTGEYDGAGNGAESPDDALDMASADGTRSILDIQYISSHPGELGCAAALTEEELQRYFGTLTPTVAQVELADALWNAIERGSARYVVLYEGGRPAKLFFAGYSLD